MWARREGVIRNGIFGTSPGPEEMARSNVDNILVTLGCQETGSWTVAVRVTLGYRGTIRGYSGNMGTMEKKIVNCYNMIGYILR